MPQFDPAKTQPLATSQRMFSDRFRLIRELGRGGMGVVWRADDTKLNRTVALKLLPDLVVRDREAMADLAAETRRCLDLTHPHIVRVYDLVAEHDHAAISMEFVDGPSLSDHKLAQPSRCFTPESLVPWIAQLCSALDYAHGKVRLVHRDLKPLNLLINSEGDLKVVDFGIARSLSKAETRLSTQVRSTGVSLAYAGPQQLLGEPPAVTDDIYSLGATLYELLTSKAPFYEGEIMTQVREVVPPTMAERRAQLGIQGRGEIPAAWEKAIAACLAKDAAARPQSAGEVAARLGVALAGITTVDRSTSERAASAPPPAVRPPPPRRRQIWVALGTIAVLALAALGYWGRDRTPADATPARGESAPRPTASAPPAPAPIPSPDSVPDSVDTPAPPAVVARGTIELRQGESGFRVPGATVRIDGREVPLTQGQAAGVEAGTRSVEITHRNYETWKQDVVVREGQTVRAPVKLVPKPGILALTVTGPTDFKLTANGKSYPVKKGRASLPPDQPLAVEISAAGFKTARRTLTVPAGRPQALTVALEKVALAVIGQPWTVPDLGLTLMPIPAGSFVMGHESGDTNERPVTRVTLTKPFWLGRTEVTQREWQVLMGETDRSYFKDASLPVQNVTWEEAMEFCRKLTEIERRADRLPAGYGYTLPTEAEWEYACRAGTTTEFSGQIVEMAWHAGNSGNTPHPVATLAANAWGLHDLHGNVWEWCADWYADKLKGGNVSDPKGPASGSFRVRRGGSWVISAPLLRSSIRGRAETDYRNYNLGFRIALVPAR
jgi:formylglycine-generating enzyme required for sulfatase activity/serine/threonine protein kinase